jgi:hypothetical protein
MEATWRVERPLAITMMVGDAGFAGERDGDDVHRLVVVERPEHEIVQASACASPLGAGPGVAPLSAGAGADSGKQPPFNAAAGA